MKSILKTPGIYFLGGALCIGFALGYFTFHSSDEGDRNHDQESQIQKAEVWTCSMHPQVRQPEPGQCPICGMDLVPAVQAEDHIDPDAIAMSETAMKLADVRTMVVSNSSKGKVLRLNGIVQIDERLQRSQPAHIAGRIESLKIAFTGEYVEKGDVIAEIYSPELLNAQKELQLAARSPDSSMMIRAAKTKLKNWKLDDDQIQKMMEEGSNDGILPIHATTSGYVFSKPVKQGDYVQRGQTLYDVVDLSNVWVMLDVYESELGWLAKGDEVTVLLGAFPGRSWQGVVTYLDPLVDPVTRIVSARVEVRNPQRNLKPGMFATGIVSADRSKDDAITVPKSAVMWTGKRSLVYVKHISPDKVAFTMRPVLLGPDLGDRYVIDSGLVVGEEIAVHGTFAIDAAAQLANKPSMMQPSPQSDSDMSHQMRQGSSISSAKPASSAVNGLLEAYDDYRQALVHDDFNQATAELKEMQSVLSKLPSEMREPLTELMHKSAQAEDLAMLRTHFKAISDAMITMASAYKGFEHPWYVQFCPMADNGRGAYWISSKHAIQNPYYGSAMLSCGSNKDTLE